MAATDIGRIAEALAAADRAGQVGEAGNGDVVDGVAARVVARPTTAEGVAAVLREATAQGLATVARGGGTALDQGAPPERADVICDLTGLDRLVEHGAGDLVVVAEGGLPVAALLETVGRAGQELVVDLPPARLTGGSTVGGALSIGMSGPRRLQRGALRDLVLGATVVLADGTIASSGGKVVKNVAGYDLAKLMTGAHGTLGVIVRAAFRLHPVRPARRWVVATGELADVAARAHDAVTSQLAPAAVEIDRPAGSDRATTAVLLEGQEDAVVRRAGEAAALVGGDVRTEPPAWWGVLPDDAGAGVLAKATATLPGVAGLLVAAQRAEERHGLGVALRGTAAGVLHAAIGHPRSAASPADPTRRGGDLPHRPTTSAEVDGRRGRGVGPEAAAWTEGVAGVVGELREVARTPGDGSVVVVRAARDVRENVDVWGPVGGLELMRAVKERLDPGRHLAPGRFVGGI